MLGGVAQQSVAAQQPGVGGGGGGVTGARVSLE
jgi:hypothetical protein